MKQNNKRFLIELLALTAATAVAMVLTGIYWLWLIGIALALNIYLLLHLERRTYEKELELISQSIEMFIDGKSPFDVPELTDSILSKLRHQLLRLQSVVYGCRQAAEKDYREIRKLIAEIAHQLRLPLANIETYLTLLKAKDLTSAEKLQYIEAVEASEEQIHFLIESFIKMARLETQIIQIKKESADLKETVMNTILQAEKAAREKQISIRFSAEGKMEVAHDKNWMGEAILNILDNSIKYSKPGSEIKVALIQNEMFAQIEIEDSGIGIEAGEENDIFKRFYRGKRVTDQKGFGLGMYLSREILTRHGGFLKVKRKEPGLSCSFYLPLGK